MYDNGDGVAQNKVEAVKWYRMAAEQGKANAQINLAVCYATGEGVQRSLSEAEKWAERAAAGGAKNAEKLWDLIPHQRRPQGIFCPSDRNRKPNRPRSMLPGLFLI